MTKERKTMKHAWKLRVPLLALVAASVLAACGGSDSGTTETTAGGGAISKESKETTGQGEANLPEPKPQVPTIVVRDGEPVGGVEELELSAGEEVRFRVSSDAAEEVHVHGYDISKEVPAGGTVEFKFPAELEGIYEAELEALGVQILELRVNP
jgi:heme/copper-type cytochrome/quinol oxidase subunit 2